MVYPHGQGGLSLCGILRIRWRGVNFSWFCADIFYGRPLNVLAPSYQNNGKIFLQLLVTGYQCCCWSIKLFENIHFIHFIHLIHFIHIHFIHAFIFKRAHVNEHIYYTFYGKSATMKDWKNPGAFYSMATKPFISFWDKTIPLAILAKILSKDLLVFYFFGDTILLWFLLKTLGKAYLTGMPLLWEFRLVITGGSLTRRPKRSLR